MELKIEVVLSSFVEVDGLKIGLIGDVVDCLLMRRKSKFESWESCFYVVTFIYLICRHEFKDYL